MCFKVIDSPYRVEILSPKVEANAGQVTLLTEVTNVGKESE